MTLDPQRQALLRQLPAVDRLLLAIEEDPGPAAVPVTVRRDAVRRVLETLRQEVLAGNPPPAAADLNESVILARVGEEIDRAMRPNLRRVVNATGVVVHTNLGRSLLAPEAIANVAAVAAGYSTLEYDLARGRRGSRYTAVDALICELTGAEAAMVVNNNAGAVLLCLDTVARDREVVVSRGELVEIGGSFRIPDVMVKSGCRLREVGTTNRTHLRDYERAIHEATGLLLKVHTSNYSIVGFTKAVALADLVRLGRDHGLPVMEDLGSGTLIDFSRYGLAREPTVQESVAAGADLVTFSGDKLLGGPQAGLIVGSREWLARIKENPLTRALRIDKLTLAALETTLRLYRDERAAMTRIPTLAMLTAAASGIEGRAGRLETRLSALDNPRLSVSLHRLSSKAGGGSFPLLDLPTVCLGVAVEGLTANAVEEALRRNDPPVIGRIEADRFVMDLRTVQEEEIELITAAFSRMLQKG